MTIYSQALGIAVILLLGYWGGRLAKKLKFPMVVGYVLTGLVLSPSLFNIIPEQLNNELEIIKILGLGIIALLIGSELEIKKIKSLGRDIMWITVVQVAGSFVVVFTSMYFILKLPLATALMLGAMSTATAPASPLAVIREYKAKGPFTSTLLGVVAMDDAVCIILFGVVSAIAAVILKGGTVGINSLIAPGIELVGSIALGAVTGIILSFFLKFVKDRHQKVLILVGMALLNSGFASIFDLSPLLVNMVTGFVVANVYERPQEINFLEDIEILVYVCFFVLAGASLHIDVLLNNWIWAAVYIIARSIGKVGGAFLGARLSGAPEVVQKYLGFAMFSKAGVTIGLIMLVQGRFPEIAVVITAIELGAITIFELFGPLGTKFALTSAGEISVDRKLK